MVKAKRIANFIYIIILLLSLTATGGGYAVAQESDDLIRQTEIVTEERLYQWWLSRWTDNLLVCQISIENEGPPTQEEVIDQCGADIFNQWLKTPPCEAAAAGESTLNCPGLYAYFAGYETGKVTTVVELPPPTVWLDVSGCTLYPPENFCTQQPNLFFKAEEPLPDYEIESVHIIAEGRKVTCGGDECEIPLRSTPFSGIEIEFWAESTFGDSSDHFTAMVRVLESGVPTNPGENGWYVNVLSSQWLGGPTETCSLIWDSFPPPGLPPNWLATPSQELLLASVEPYQYLAGRLITQGLVDYMQMPVG
jgi:hypothetical protein